MQTASANFTAAVSATSGVWAPPQVHADWANNGYDGDNTVDDLSPLAGRPITVNQALDDGMPSDVSLTSGVDATAKVSIPVGGKTVAGVPLSGPQYWSVDNTSSPLSTYDRDVAALTVAHGLVTAGGIERVTIFTGQMSDAPVTNRTATVEGVSKTRMKLTTSVQPPGVRGYYAGLNATWPIVWTLAQCGIYVSPPPRTGARWWSPMHGSLKPVIPTRQDTSRFREFISGQRLDASATAAVYQRPTFVAGPYLTASYNKLVTAQSLSANVQAINLASGPDLISKAGNAGRVEFWLRGDAADTVTGPDILLFGSISGLAVFKFVNSNGTSVIAGLGTDRKVFVTVADGAHTTTLKSTATLPTDGNWYFVGAAWDVANNKLWVDYNGTVASSTPSPAMTTTGLPATDGWYDGVNYEFFSYLPIAEVHLTAGAQANPDNFVWVNDANYTWTAGATLRASILELDALGEPKAREAWEFISSFAQAELAAVRTDELDQFCYFPLSYWAEPAQQTAVDVWSTSTNVGDFTPSRDPTKIRNQVTVNFKQTTVNEISPSAVYVGFSIVTVPTGTSTFTAALGDPIAEIASGQLTNMTAANVANPSTVSSGLINIVCINSAADGSGSYATSTQVSASVTSWTPSSITVTFTNSTGSIWYLTNGGNSGLPFIQLAGYPIAAADATVTVNNAASQSARGVRGLTVSLPAIQDATTATTIANELLARSLAARPQLALTARGDPRRQPGDLATFADPANTGLAGQWRSAAVATRIDGADMTQDITAIQAWPVLVWGQGKWGQTIWGP